MSVKVLIQRLPHGEDLPLPAYQSPQSAGMDLMAALPGTSPQIIEPGGRALIPAGFAMALPQGYEAQIRPRSGLALKHGISVLNAPGTIDADYRGEVKILLINLGPEPFAVERGERIAQMVIMPVTQAALAQVRELEESARGTGRFGSTGRR